MLLAEQPMHGYQIIQELLERSAGAWQASPGSIYPKLQQLEEDGLVRGEEHDGKRIFALTDDGRAAVDALPADKRAPWEDLASDFDGTIFEMKDLIANVAGAVRQVVRAGSSRQLERARDLLKETRRSLYRILAEDDPPED